jgi:hypothetical protein
MSSSINTVWASPDMWRTLTIFATLFCVAAFATAQVDELRAPANAVAGNAAAIQASGGGSATFYLMGPSASLKREVKLGGEIQLAAQDLQSAGGYLAIVCADTCRSLEFFVAPSKPSTLAFLVHPSRAPVRQNNAVTGVAFPFDEFHNMVFAPATVDFQLTANGANLMSHAASTQGGVAWFRTSSGANAGALQVTASIKDVIARRVVQQVASDPCHLAIKGERNAKGIAVETEPVRDCAGNPVPDGTVVTFTARDGTETSTVDAPIKQGIARAEMSAKGPAVVSAASGVVMGNELKVGR